MSMNCGGSPSHQTIGGTTDSMRSSSAMPMRAHSEYAWSVRDGFPSPAGSSSSGSPSTDSCAAVGVQSIPFNAR